MKIFLIFFPFGVWDRIPNGWLSNLQPTHPNHERRDGHLAFREKKTYFSSTPNTRVCCVCLCVCVCVCVRLGISTRITIATTTNNDDDEDEDDAAFATNEKVQFLVKVKRSASCLCYYCD